MFRRFLTIGAAALGLSTFAFVAAPTTGYAATCSFGDGGTALQAVLDGITTAPVGGDSSVDVTTDCLPDGADDLWSIDGSGGSITTIVIELAGFAGSNTFGIYDANDPNSQVQVFGGGDGAGDQRTISILLDGSVIVSGADSGIDFAANQFGYYLDASIGNADPNAVWFSNTGLNSDLTDHMYAYQGNNIDTIQVGLFAPGLFSDNEHILAFEDLDCSGGFGPGGSCDADYTDFVVIVESVTPVPEPATLALFGAGLLGLGFLARRRKNRHAA